MKRIVKVKNEYDGDSKYTLKQEYNGFALYIIHSNGNTEI